MICSERTGRRLETTGPKKARALGSRSRAPQDDSTQRTCNLHLCRCICLPSRTKPGAERRRRSGPARALCPVMSATAKALVLAKLEPRPGGGFALPESAARALTDALERRFAARSDGHAELRAMLRLVVVLERDPASLVASRSLLGALRASPAVRRVLAEARIEREQRARSTARSFSRFEARGASRHPPRVDTPRPTGTLPGHELMRPLPRPRGERR